MASQTSAVGRTSSVRPEDQAATAALHATKGSQKSKQYRDSDIHLSSAGELQATSGDILGRVCLTSLRVGATASLKYADVKDLPSFPSTGRKNDNSAAGTAATLGWAKQTTIEPSRPDQSASASKA